MRTIQNQKDLLDEKKRTYKKFLNADERFKELKDNEQRQVLNVLAKNKEECNLRKVALSIVMDTRGY